MRIDEFSSTTEIDSTISAIEMRRFLTFGFDLYTTPSPPAYIVFPVLSNYELYLSVTSSDELILDVRS